MACGPDESMIDPQQACPRGLLAVDQDFGDREFSSPQARDFSRGIGDAVVSGPRSGPLS